MRRHVDAPCAREKNNPILLVIRYFADRATELGTGTRSANELRPPLVPGCLLVCILLFACDTFGQGQQNRWVPSQFNNVELFRSEYIGQLLVVENRQQQHVMVLKVDQSNQWNVVLRSASWEQAADWAKQQQVQDEEQSTQEALRQVFASDQSRDEFVEWAEQVILFSEFGIESDDKSNGSHKRNRINVRRWTAAPTIQLIDAGDRDERAVEDAVAILNSALAATQLGELQVAEEDSDIVIHFCPENRMPAVAAQYGFQLPNRNQGCFYLHWDAQQRLTKAHILIASDIDEDLLRHLVLEELTQSLGVMNDSGKFADSIFYDQFSLTFPLHVRDVIVLQILYSRLEPGERRSSCLRKIKRAAAELARSVR